ncbi:MAG: transcription elongation factor GreA [Alphaproteobacteria bacterium]|nr:transcription elongation factor GreA [Alphaproteobacteria bacterium]
MNKEPMTADGYQRLVEELKRLKSIERPAIIRAIAEARGHGDLSENAEYHAAKEKQGFIEARIQELEGLVSRAEIIDSSKFSGDGIKFGATVQLVDEESGEASTYVIVGTSEGNIKSGRLAISAPLARALIGKNKGDSIEVVTPKGEKYYKVRTVEYK